MIRSLVLAVVLGATVAAEQPQKPSQFTFAWPFGEGMAAPRGATTRGAPVELETAPGALWQSLREGRTASAFERDRRAILAMAGQYRVSFDFLEVVRYDPSLKADAPYQSWGTEQVFVAEDRKDFIALQHVLVMRVVMADGKISEPHVVRHWRQEWRFEPERYLVYDGANTWSMREFSAERRRGAWVQSVLQVDDSPRYSAAGRWEHSDSFSTWLSEETRRPLPRREFSVRKDYDVLAGTNRHTIVPTGWVQEENNLKLALAPDLTPRAALPYVAREYGVARYERIRNFDFGPGETYFTRSEPFWADVRAAWREIAEREKRFTMKAQPDQGRLLAPFFEYADKLAEGGSYDRDAGRAFIQRTIRDTYLAGK